VGHPGALLAALIPADELQELMDKMDGNHPAGAGVSVVCAPDACFSAAKCHGAAWCVPVSAW
jgi:hypothetical protein